MNTQNTETPKELINALEDYFQVKFLYDLAASAQNRKAKYFYNEFKDSLSIDWPTDSWNWLNPPYRNLTKWIDKCVEQKNKGSKIITIWPCSCDLNQIKTFKNADVYMIHGRVWGLVRGCMICVWNKQSGGSIKGLSWDKKELKRIW